MTKPPRPPADLERRGRAFWRAVAGAFELRPDERELLDEAARCLDRLDALRAVVKREGLTAPDRHGRPALHPAAVEERQQRHLLRFLLAQLALPDEGGETAGTRSARAAARARWDGRLRAAP